RKPGTSATWALVGNDMDADRSKAKASNRKLMDIRMTFTTPRRMLSVLVRPPAGFWHTGVPLRVVKCQPGWVSSGMASRADPTGVRDGCRLLSLSEAVL